MFVAIIDGYRGQKAALRPPMMGAGGRPYSLACRHNPRISGKKGRPQPPLDGETGSGPVACHGRRHFRDLSRRAVGVMICPRRHADWGRFAASGGCGRNAKIARRRRRMDFRRETNLHDVPREIVVVCRHLPPLYWSLGPHCGIDDFGWKIKSPLVPS